MPGPFSLWKNWRLTNILRSWARHAVSLRKREIFLTTTTSFTKNNFYYFWLRQALLFIQTATLLIFLFLHLGVATLLLFASPDFVKDILAAQSLTAVAVAEVLLVSGPLFLSLFFSVLMLAKSPGPGFHDFIGNTRFHLRRLSTILLLVFVSFHLYLGFSAFSSGAQGLQYVQDILMASESRIFMSCYWTVLILGSFYLSENFWHVCIDLGIAAGRASQRRVRVLSGIFFGVFLFWIAFLIIDPILKNK